MKSKITRRLAATLATGAVAASLMAVTSTSAQAATTYVDTQVTLKPTYKFVTFGTNVGFSATATTVNGPYTYPMDDQNDDRVYLQRSIAGGAFKTIHNGTGTSEYWNFGASSTARYRACYTGATDADYSGTNVTVYKASCSAPYTTAVKYRINTSGFRAGRKAGFRGTVSPKFKGKVKYQTKKRGKWVTIKKFKLKKGKKFSVIMNGGNRQLFRVVVPGTKKNKTNSVTYRLYRYYYRSGAGAAAATPSYQAMQLS